MDDTRDYPEVIKSIPLIPLRELVIFPSTLVPFIIGRPSSKRTRWFFYPLRWMRLWTIPVKGISIPSAL